MLLERRRCQVKSLFNERYEFQEEFIKELVLNGYIERKNDNFDRSFAMDREILFKFLESTQPKVVEELKKVFKDDYEETITSFINNEITKKHGSLLNTLKNGFEISNRKVELMYTRPATDFNKDLNEKYENNIFSVMQEVTPKDDERVDVVIFLNGLAIMTFELKSEFSGQSVEDAICQYRLERDPKSRLFLWKSGALVNFAMDTSNVFMTTKLDKEKTFFMPFNMGRGEGVNTGAGNPIFDDKYSVSYMWEDILKKDTILELISKFIFIEEAESVDNVTGKTSIKETVIFPRYHQLDLIRKILADVKVNKTSLNYLIEHSAGSGKTNSIAWLSHRLVSVHDDDNEVIYDSIVIITDRVVVDRQLQKAVLGLDHAHGLIRVLDDNSNSNDLKIALESNTKIIATTIQKFPYVVDELRNLKNKKFAVIIDEAHSSTAGRNMQAVTKSLGSDDFDYENEDDMIIDEIKRSGKQSNVSMFAFTATPKPTTLRMFGRLNRYGQYEAFHLYSMKQAIEEGFILDVLASYTTYRTMYKINKAVKDDPELETSDAKRQIARFIELHDTNITQRVQVIIEHFRNNVMNGLGGQAKAMVVTASRQGAVKYKKAFEKYIADHKYYDINALVAFSGKVILEDDETVYTEVGINKMSESDVPNAFDSDNYNVMIVANKYQTGFDQKKLCAMYVMKKLRGVNAVQTLSRLNRVCPPYDKKVFVLDFENDYDDIKNAFAPYYTTTILANDITPGRIHELVVTIDAYNVIDPLDVERFNELIFKERKKNITPTEKKSLLFILRKTEKNVRGLEEDHFMELKSTMNGFKRFYEYLIQVSCFEDKEVHKKYIFISYLLDLLNIGSGGGGFDLKGKISAENFNQEKIGEFNKENIPKPFVNIASAGGFAPPEDKIRKLSEILEEINAKSGMDFDVDVAMSAIYQIKDIMMKSDKLRTSAKNNTEDDFRFSYFSNVNDALVKGLDQNQDFFTMLLNDQDMKKEVLGLFIPEIYKSLRQNL
ncbi:DEAD/DEAH box helicase family protein [Peptoniphilus sp. MSJ-1]|uniref:DEAD/DEAH box helicase family protein n=1 Tax=Peptoniphilus ovalis TaxID=2841503 RepID=A0ABS6FEH7_9FIRM|nr:DEAD/DEAH box helicase family protein [Peptoniphilus ovalis]